MSTREISGLTGKRHDNVMRDTRVMLEQMGEGGVLKFEDTHWNEQNGQEYPIFRLPKRECLILVSGYDVILRTRIIDRWMALEAAISVPAIDYGRISVMIADAVNALQPSRETVREMVQSELAAVNFTLRQGCTAGQVYRAHGFPPIKGLAGWLGNRMSRLGFGIANDGRAQLGAVKARLYDPDKVSAWVRTGGGRKVIEDKVAERQKRLPAQCSIRLVSPPSESDRTF